MLHLKCQAWYLTQSSRNAQVQYVLSEMLGTMCAFEFQRYFLISSYSEWHILGIEPKVNQEIHEGDKCLHSFWCACILSAACHMRSDVTCPSSTQEVVN